MAQKHTLEELNNCSREELITIVPVSYTHLDVYKRQVCDHG